MGQARPEQEAVDRAARAEDVQPRVDAQQVARPEGQDAEHEQEPLVAPAHVADEPVRERERDRQRHRRRDDRHPDRRPHRVDVGRDAEEVAVVVERPVVDDVVVDRLPEAVADDQPERDEEEQPEQDERGQEARVLRQRRGTPAAGRLPRRRPAPPRGSSRASCSDGYAPNTSLKASTYACSSPAGPLIVIFSAFSGWL